MKEALESLHDCMIGSALDWAAASRDAWMYGIVVGWGDEGALEEVAKAHDWSEQSVERLKKLRASVEEVTKL